MPRVTVVTGFYDSVARVHRHPGDAFDATEDRANDIASRLPGYVDVSVDAPGEDLGAMTLAELRALAESRGIEVPKRVRKADLVEILGV